METKKTKSPLLRRMPTCLRGKIIDLFQSIDVINITSWPPVWGSKKAAKTTFINPLYLDNLSLKPLDQNRIILVTKMKTTAKFRGRSIWVLIEKFFRFVFVAKFRKNFRKTKLFEVWKLSPLGKISEPFQNFWARNEMVRWMVEILQVLTKIWYTSTIQVRNLGDIAKSYLLFFEVGVKQKNVM